MNRFTKSCLVASLALLAGTLGACKSGGSKVDPAVANMTDAEMMQVCMVAGTPGDQHKNLAKGAGTWKGSCEMWMGPDAPSITTECTSTNTMILDGRYMHVVHKGEIPEMGTYHGEGINGFDNVTGKFVGTWYDNHSTGIMTGTGDISPDGRTLTWTFKYNCPILKKPVVMREVQTFTSDSTMNLEMYGTDPKSGKEFKMMQFKLRKS